MKKQLRLIAILVFLVCAAPATQAQTDVRANSAYAFLNSLGVNTHAAQGYNPARYAEPLRNLGVRNIRDGAKNISAYFMLHETAGVRVDLIGGDRLSDLIEAAKRLAGHDSLMAVEGPNEPNNWPITYDNKRGGGSGTWVPVADYQQALYEAVKSDPLLKKYPVFHVSEGGAETDNVGMQFLVIPPNAATLLPAGTKFADYANVHNYVSGHDSHYSDNQAWQAADATLDGRWDGLYGEYGRTWKEKFSGYSNEDLKTLPRVTTETGWDSEVAPEGEKIQGTVLVNTYLAQFKRGWKYTFIYELADGEGGDGHQGLYHKDWTPKPAAIYIHNLTAILDDKKPPAQFGVLPYSIAHEPETVHDLLLQKSDGVFFLVIWGEKAGGAENIVVNLGSLRSKIRIYDVTRGAEPQSTLTQISQIPLTLSDHPLILEIH